MNETAETASTRDLSNSFSSYASTNATTLDEFNELDEFHDANDGNLAGLGLLFNDASDTDDSVIPATPTPPVIQPLTQLNKFTHILDRLGYDINVIIRAQTYADLDELTDVRTRRNNSVYDRYKTFASNLGYDEKGIGEMKSIKAAAPRAKKRIIKNTGLAEYRRLRFGEKVPVFTDEEMLRLRWAFSSIKFINGDEMLQRKYIHAWCTALSTSRQDLGQSKPVQTIILGKKTKPMYKKLRSAFTRDIFIDSRFHRVDEIEDIFLQSQGLKEIN